VPNITLGPAVVKAIAPAVHERGGALDVHLMIEHPERYVDAFAMARIHPDPPSIGPPASADA